MAFSIVNENSYRRKITETLNKRVFYCEVVYITTFIHTTSMSLQGKMIHENILVKALHSSEIVIIDYISHFKIYSCNKMKELKHIVIVDSLHSSNIHRPFHLVARLGYYR